jgi:hypothetical protein
MPITFETATAPTVTRVTEENPFTSVIAEMPLTGEGKDHTGRDMVPAGTPGGALAFTLPGTAIARGDSANPALAKAIRQLNAAADQRPGGAVTVRKSVAAVEPLTDSKGKQLPAKDQPEMPAVTVLFYLVPKVRRSPAAVASTPNTTAAAS